MPKLYEYFGLRIYFYANEHEPVHVHGFCQGCESKAEILINDGRVDGIRILSVAGMRPLTGSAMADFKLLVSRKAEEIVRKWVEFFVNHQQIKTEIINRRLK